VSVLYNVTDFLLVKTFQNNLKLCFSSLPSVVSTPYGNVLKVYDCQNTRPSIATKLNLTRRCTASEPLRHAALPDNVTD